MSDWHNAEWINPSRPYAIAHRGASAYAADCSLEAYKKASRLGADMWEVDIRLSQDGVLITYHDAHLPDGTPLNALTAVQIEDAAAAQSVPAVPFIEVVKLALELEAGIYADIKDVDATLPLMELLRDSGVQKAVLGAFDPEVAKLLRAANAPYPSSVLVPIDADPFVYADAADIMHLCWERMERPQDLLDDAFFQRVKAENKRVVVWHEEDPDRMAALRDLPVLGICSDRPELVHPWRRSADWPVEIVCHRGACEFAPENTLSAAHCVFAGGFDVVELDVRQTSDDQHIILHDRTVERTSSGAGEAREQDFATLRKMDAGTWYDPFYHNERFPTLTEMLDIAEQYDRTLYVELKSANVQVLLDEIGSAGRLKRCMFWSFKYELLREVFELEPSARFMLRRQDFPSLDELLDDIPTIMVEYELGVDVDEAEFVRCRDAGRDVMIAYMGQDESQFQNLIDLHPDLVNLHFPYAFRDYLNQFSLLNER